MPFLMPAAKRLWAFVNAQKTRTHILAQDKPAYFVVKNAAKRVQTAALSIFHNKIRHQKLYKEKTILTRLKTLRSGVCYYYYFPLRYLPLSIIMPTQKKQAITFSVPPRPSHTQKVTSFFYSGRAFINTRCHPSPGSPKTPNRAIINARMLTRPDCPSSFCPTIIGINANLCRSLCTHIIYPPGQS